MNLADGADMNRMERALRVSPQPGGGPTLQSGNRFAIRFLLACLLLFAFLELTPDPVYYPVNRATTVSAAALLKIMGFGVHTRGLVISLEGFRAQVIGECSAVFLAVLPLAFIWAYPAPITARLKGWGAGLTVLFVVNLLRIALLIIIGARVPRLFEPIHLYLAQAGMILTVLAVCLAWVKWLSGDWQACLLGPITLRFVLVSALAFGMWLSFSGMYIGLVYRVLHAALGRLDIAMEEG